MKLERVVLDVGALPNAADEVALADEFPCGLDKELENLKGTASKRNTLSADPQLSAGKIDLTAT
jgi:hypothetical protein